MLCKKPAIISWIVQVIVALVLFQTLFFKFTGAPEPRYIFTKLGMEPWGRIGSGVVELVAVVLLLIPRTAVFGAILAAGVIGGAIASHLTGLGIAIPDPADPTRTDGGLLFMLALIVLAGSLVIAFLRRSQLPMIGRRLGGSCACTPRCAA
jgi:putative oxidoreductase